MSGFMSYLNKIESIMTQEVVNEEVEEVKNEILGAENIILLK